MIINNKIKTPDDIFNLTTRLKYDNFTKEEKYIIKNKDQLLTSGKGICYDVVELERYYFTKLKYKFKTFFFYEDLPITDHPTHTVLIFEEKNKFYWFESSWASYRAIHGPFKNYDVAVDYITSQLIKSTNWKHVFVKEYSKFDFSNLNINQFGEKILNIDEATIFFLPIETRPKDLPRIVVPGDYWHVGIIYKHSVYETFNLAKYRISSVEKRKPELIEQKAVFKQAKIFTHKLMSEIKSGTSCGTYVARVLGYEKTTGSIKTEYPQDVFNHLK